MLNRLHEGDTSQAHCSQCGKLVKTRFERRTVQPRGSRVSFQGVLVGVCTECDYAVLLPRQSIAQFLELSGAK